MTLEFDVNCIAVLICCLQSSSHSCLQHDPQSKVLIWNILYLFTTSSSVTTTSYLYIYLLQSTIEYYVYKLHPSLISICHTFLLYSSINCRSPKCEHNLNYMSSPPLSPPLSTKSANEAVL